MAEQPTEVLTTREAAALLRLHPEQVLILAARKEIPGKKVGGVWRFLRSKLLDYLAKGVTA
jgi:excisionase family DNA binding protein